MGGEVDVAADRGKPGDPGLLAQLEELLQLLRLAVQSGEEREPACFTLAVALQVVPQAGAKWNLNVRHKLVDALTPLADGGYIWLLTPKAGRSGHVEPSDIGEAAPTAGLSQTSSVSAARDWSGSRLVAPKARR